MARGYHARMRIYNDMKRDALLVPDKGNPDGFIIHAGKNLEISLIDLSTDGKTVAPITMNAYDAETRTRIKINNDAGSIQILPTLETEYKDLVLSAPGIIHDNIYILCPENLQMFKICAFVKTTFD